MKKSTLSKCLLLLLLAWLCASCSVGLASQAQPLQTYKQIPIEVWEQLKQNHQSLVLKLEEAKLQATKLRKHSEELTNRLTHSEETLTMLEQELTKSKEALTNLNEHLQNVEQLQERTRTSLSELTTQIEAERKKQKAIELRHKVQKVFWFIGGYVLGKEIGKAVD